MGRVGRTHPFHVYFLIRYIIRFPGRFLLIFTFIFFRFLLATRPLHSVSSFHRQFASSRPCWSGRPSFFSCVAPSINAVRFSTVTGKRTVRLLGLAISLFLMLHYDQETVYASWCHSFHVGCFSRFMGYSTAYYRFNLPT